MEEPRRSFLGRLPRRAWRLWTRLVHILSSALFGVLLIALGVTFVNYVVLSTPKDRAYRNLSPDYPGCREGLAHGWSVLVDTGTAGLSAALLSRHDGYRLTSFICAMNTLVMDDITSDPLQLRPMTSDVRQPGSATLK